MALQNAVYFLEINEDTIEEMQRVVDGGREYEDYWAANRCSETVCIRVIVSEEE